MPKTKKTPSRTKFEMSHPVISARLPIETRDKLLLNLEKAGMSLADAFKVLAEELDLQIKPIEEVKKAGFEQGKNIYGVSYRCYVCGKPKLITSLEEKIVAGKFLTEHGWGHDKCLEQPRES